MPQQLDLIEPQRFMITPAPGRAGPRLWIKRLVIWSEPAGDKIRDIALRPGLNIAWSPDRADQNGAGRQQSAIGHGSGKTLFCRMIRYCLGEDRFATEAERLRIGRAFMNGLVGAEIVLDGTPWAVVRPLGVRRRHMAVPNADLDELAAGDGASTGIAPLVEAIDQAIITPALAGLVRPRGEGPSWPITLAWLARDQECRFDDALDWRSPSSDSDSPLPASGAEKGPRLDALRAFLKAITPEEYAARAEVNRLDDQRREQEQAIAHSDWQIQRAQDRLTAALGLTGRTLPEMPLLIEVLRSAAAERLARATGARGEEKTDLATTRQTLGEARSEWARLDARRTSIETSIPLMQRLLSRIQGELPALSFATAEAETQVCPICEVPIDRAIAEKCKLSHKLHDPAECRARWERRKREFEEQKSSLDSLKQERNGLLPQLAVAKQTLERAEALVGTIERARDGREARWYEARRLQDEVEQLAALVQAKEAATEELASLSARLADERGKQAALRHRQAQVFQRMTDKFDPIVRRLLGGDSKGQITLLGTGLQLSIQMGGDRSTAAIESLKVLAFDLAAMCLSIEGHTRVPAFLIHDSPREADLGLSIYHQLFHLVRELEQLTGEARFQYIVTTTTRPPDEFARPPWLVLEIEGSPAEKRLLRCDL